MFQWQEVLGRAPPSGDFRTLTSPTSKPKGSIPADETDCLQSANHWRRVITQQQQDGTLLHPDSEPAVRSTCFLHNSQTTPADLLYRGKTRLAKWYSPYNDDEKIKLKGEIHRLVAPRDQKHQSNFVEFRGASKVVYRRYAGLFFCACVDANDNELAYLEAIHFFVEVLDQFFGNVCELDLVFNFYKVSPST
jgi:AP-2 complex subunit sigma-1